MRRENSYQASLIKRLKREFPGAVVLKNDSSYQQGIPDLSIFYGPRWAVLEDKRDKDEPLRPNQQWWVDRMRDMSYAAIVFPQNEEEIFRELHYALEPRRHPRFLKSE